MLTSFLYTCTPVHLYTCTSVHLHICTHVHMYTCTHVHMYTCTPVRLYASTPAHLAVQITEKFKKSHIYLSFNVTQYTVHCTVYTTYCFTH